MKKLLISAVAVSMLATSAMAGVFDGKITSLKSKFNGEIVISVTHSGGVKTGLLVGLTDEAKKTLTAVALTAKSMNSDVQMTFDEIGNGEYGWKIIELK